jgi:hypothetical protein
MYLLDRLMSERKAWDPIQDKYQFSLPVLQLWLAERLRLASMSQLRLKISRNANNQTFAQMRELVRKAFDDSEDMRRQDALWDRSRKGSRQGLTTSFGLSSVEGEEVAQVAKWAGERKCYNCGKPGHVMADCKVKLTDGLQSFQKGGKVGVNAQHLKCFNCGGVGHVARQCSSPSTKRQPIGQGRNQRQEVNSKQRNVRYVVKN